ncbi:hypothetical protein GCM10027425_25400 [Alteromonas gracilis]
MRRALLVLGLVAVALGLLSLLTNITTTAQLEGRDELLNAVRKSATRVLNSGTVWAGLSVLAGWLVRRPALAAAAGAGAGLLALLVHYGAGVALGVFGTDAFSSNATWFAAAVVAGPALGLVGAAARRTEALGLLARLVVPVGAVLEPWVVGWLTPGSAEVWSNRVSGYAAAAVLFAAGTLGLVLVLRSVMGPGHQSDRSL